MGIEPYLTGGCATEPGSPEPPARLAPQFDFALSGYFPPSEANGGWRKTSDSEQIAELG